MKFLIKLVLSLLIAAGIGFVSAYLVIEKKSAEGALMVGSWRINTNIGAEDTDPYIRASVALHGLLALNKSEAIYFSAYEDKDGAPLTGGCSYKVSGTGIAARWWTITAYGADDYLIPGAEGHFAVSVHELGDKQFSFPIRPELTANEVGLATAEAKSFLLLLRAYNPNPVLLNDPASAVLPVIEKESCND